MKTGRVVGLRWLPQELLLEVLAFAPMRSYGRLAACSGFLERLVREHADWTACYATLRGGAPDDDDACGEDGVVERAAAPGTARSNPGGVRTPPAFPRRRAKQAFALMDLVHDPRRRLRVVSQTLPGACRRGFAVTALAARGATARWRARDDAPRRRRRRRGGHRVLVVLRRPHGRGRGRRRARRRRRAAAVLEPELVAPSTRARRSNRVRFSELIWGEDAGYGVTAFTCGYDGLPASFLHVLFRRASPSQAREFDPRAAGGPPSREVRQVAFARGGARLLTACYDGTASAWAVSGPPAPREVIADHRGHAVERIAVDGDATLASVDFTGCLKLSRLDEAKVAVRHLDVDGDAGSPTCVAAPSFDEPAAAVALRPEPDLPKTRALALATGSLASLSVLALGHCDGTVSTVALPFAGPSFRKREAELRRKVPAGHVWDGARRQKSALHTMVHKIILALALCGADAFVPAGLSAPSSALSVATLEKAEAKTAAWPAKTAAWRAACDASGVVSYADFGIRVGAVEEVAPAPRVVVAAGEPMMKRLGVYEADEDALLAASTFPLAPDALIARCKEVLGPEIGVGTKDGGACLAEDFEFCAAVVGPIGKEAYLEALGTFQLEDAFPDLDPKYHLFRVDPFDEGRVWFHSRSSATHTEPLMGKPATGKKLELPPQCFHIDFTAEGLVKEIGFYVIDRRVGNTGGLGGAFAFFYGTGNPLPIPECQPYKPSKRFRLLNFVGKLGAKFAKKE
ncbi:hypothetical protein SO694_00016230 [Aureococcus anophagefferens]|uniref:F-box domain-containing protein n=1 Tax=Aureococcus anophagefferens TaxID=44056 RepID=A0ABR1G214_AURAN